MLRLLSINHNKLKNIDKMINRLTDLWPNLIRRIRGGQDSDDPDPDSDREALIDPGQVQEVEEAELTEFYKNQYWTRLMNVERYEQGQERKHAMGPDIIEECLAIHSLPEVEPDAWAPFFEPTSFTEQHGPLKVDDYMLSQDELRQWAERCTRL